MKNMRKKPKIYLLNKKTGEVKTLFKPQRLTKKQLKAFSTVISLTIICLIVSAFLDLTLWFRINYMVPSFTVALMSLMFAVLLFVFLSQIEHERNSRGRFT